MDRKTNDAPVNSDETTSSLTRRGMISSALAAGAGAVLAPTAFARQNGSATTQPSYGPDGNPLPAEYVDGLTPGMHGPGQAVRGYAAPLAKTPLKPITIKRREVGDGDVELDILFCGICHSDIHVVNNDWKNSVYPSMPGHEFVGRVTRVGGGVTKFKPGDVIAVGPVIDSCGKCKQCKEELEQFCEGPKGRTEAYNGPAKPDGTNTYGGYSERYVVKERFAYHVPENLDPKGVAPLLCAGMTVYSPLKHWRVGPGMKVAVVGMGGLGHMAVKLASSMGAEVTVLSTTPEKEADAKKFGAKQFVLVTDETKMKALELTQDLIINTIPYPYDPNTYVKTLARDGTMVVVGLIMPFGTPPDGTFLVMHRRGIVGSLIGGSKEYQPFLDYCGQKNITATVETIPLEGINDAYPKVKSKQVRYRYVIDIAGSAKQPNGA